MIVCPNPKVSFIHIYKTGGSSLTRVLSDHTVEGLRGKNPRFDGDGWQGTWHVNSQQHSKFKDNQNQLKDIIDDSWIHLVVCRNPYDWFASVFYEFYAENKNWKAGSNFLFGQFSKNRTFEDFIDFYEEFEAGYPDFWGFSSQRSFVDGIDKINLRTIRFEAYEESVQKNLLDLGIPVVALPHDLKRGSEKGNFKSYIKSHPKFTPFVNRVFEKDFEFFSYDMDGM